MKRLVALLTALCLAVTPVAVLAEEDTTDVLDNSAELAQVEENGIPTEELVNELKANADALYEEGKYEEAAVAYYDTARKSNFLANIMSQCGEPYYSSRSDSKTLPDEIYDDLLVLENKSNSLKEIRNTCYVYQGLCCSKMGDDETALAVLLDALDLIENSQHELWTLAAEEVMSIIQYESDDATKAKKEERLQNEKDKKEAITYKGKSYEEFKKRFGKARDSYVSEYFGETSYYYNSFTVTVDNKTDKVKEVDVY